MQFLVLQAKIAIYAGIGASVGTATFNLLVSILKNYLKIQPFFWL